MPDIARALGGDPSRIISSSFQNGAVHQHARGGLHGAPNTLVDGAQTRGIDHRAAADSRPRSPAPYCRPAPARRDWANRARVCSATGSARQRTPGTASTLKIRGRGRCGGAPRRRNGPAPRAWVSRGSDRHTCCPCTKWARDGSILAAYKVRWYGQPAVHQDDGGNGTVAQGAARLQIGIRLQLRPYVRRGVHQHPAGGPAADGDGGLRSAPAPEVPAR